MPLVCVSGMLVITHFGFNEVGKDVALDEGRILKHLQMERDSGLDTFDLDFLERTLTTRDRLCTIGTPHDDLGDHGIRSRAKCDRLAKYRCPHARQGLRAP